jgi:hypothetical protein
MVPVPVLRVVLIEVTRVPPPIVAGAIAIVIAAAAAATGAAAAAAAAAAARTTAAAAAILCPSRQPEQSNVTLLDLLHLPTGAILDVFAVVDATSR